MKRLLSIIALTLSPGFAWAQLPAQPATVASSPKPRAPDETPKPNLEKPERGWFFFDDPKKAEEVAPPPPPPVKPLPKELPPPPKEEKCAKKDSWTPDCGFVNPGTDFEFQAKQRDSLMERMVVSQNDPKAVEDFQYYMRWALERTAEVTNLWYYNMVQNPELDPTAAQPINAMGLRLMTDVRSGKDAEFSKLMAEEGAFLIYFSKTDCHFCHAMSPLAKELGKQLGIPVRNAALDDRCLPGLEEGCVTAPRTTVPAQALQVSVVPTIFLYVPKNTFIRIATGVTDVATMKARTMQFFQATRTAMLKGVENGSGSRPSVDFSEADKVSGDAKGVVPTTVGRVPTETEMAQMLGARH